jgi:hypothetical protein
MITGEAYINFELWKLFAAGRDAILAGSCGGAVPIKDDIMKLMTVPLVQGTLRYSNYCDNGKECTAKAIGEFTAFAFSVLPQVHACDAAAATLIATAANPASYTCTSSDVCSGSSNDFAAIKVAFESCYSDMGITCAQVGGLYDADNLAYLAGKEPCVDNPPVTVTVAGAAGETTNKLEGGGLVAIIVCGALAALCAMIVVFIYCKEKNSGKPIFNKMQGGASA